ncbi:hypothetical protein BAUCODRAFT_42909, partial [Baudoinia panamericana UAMH 10762]
LYHHIEHAFRQQQDQLALIVAYQPADHLSHVFSTAYNTSGSPPNSDLPCLAWTFAQVHELAFRLWAGLSGEGIRPGATLMTLVVNRAEFIVLYYMAIVMRLTFVPLDPGALGQPRKAELENSLRVLKPDLVVVADAQGMEAVRSAFGVRSPSVGLQLDGQVAQADAWTDMTTLLAEAKNTPVEETAVTEALRDVDLDRTHLILFTSGTSSGKPKGCPRSVRSMSNINNAAMSTKEYPIVRYLQVTSNFRAVFPAFTITAWRDGGAVVIASPAYDTSVVLDAIDRFKISTTGLVPAMVHAIGTHPNHSPQKVASVTGVRLGGDMITRDLLQKAASVFPAAQVSTAHGMTEGGGFFEWPFFETPLADIPYYGEISPLGLATPQASLRIWDTEHNKVARRGELGELHILARDAIERYLEGVNEDSFYEDAEGRWLRSGDLATMTKDGLFYILGRIKDVIKRAGVSITPAALESAISSFSGSQTAVVAVPSPTLGAEPFAVLEKTGGWTADEIKHHVLELFNKDYALRDAASLEQLGLTGFPLNASGKIQKLDLLKHVEGWMA